jgi:hypothetical protein
LPPRPWCSSSSARQHAACRRPEQVLVCLFIQCP